jgi:uncharacterized protein YxjI
MRYQLTAQWPALTDTFEARDEHGKLCYSVKAKVFGLRDALTILGPDGRPAAKLSAGWVSGWTLAAADGAALASIGGGSRPTIEASGQKYRVVGDVAGREYQVTDKRRVLATVSKKLVSLTDQYGLEVPDPADTLLAVGIAVALHRQAARREG